MNSVRETLLAAADLIEPKGAWTQNRIAKSEDGRTTDPEKSEAVCWCGYGAMVRVIRTTSGRPSFLEYEASDALHDWARENGFPHFGGFNDAPERTQAEVVAALRAAAEKADA